MRLPARLAFPCERAVRKANLHAVPGKEVSPEDTDLLTLGDRIGGDEGDFYLSAVDVVGGEAIPSGDKVEHARAFHVAPNEVHISLLFGILFLLADEGWVAEDVG